MSAQSAEETSFGYRTAWLAARMEAPNRIVQALGLRNAAATSPARGVQHAYAWDPAADHNPVFVTPPIYGWVLCVGQALLAFADSNSPAFADLVARLSAELRCDVQYFCTHRIVEAHGWARADAGRLLRAYLYVGESGETVVDRGELTADERHLGFALFATAGADPAKARQASYPTEDDVMRLAGRWSLDPTKLPAMGDGLLAELPRPSKLDAGHSTGTPAKKTRWKFW